MPPLRAAYSRRGLFGFGVRGSGHDDLMMMMRTIFFRPVGVLKIGVSAQERSRKKEKKGKQDRKGVEVRSIVEFGSAGGTLGRWNRELE